MRILCEFSGIFYIFHLSINSCERKEYVIYM